MGGRGEIDTGSKAVGDFLAGAESLSNRKACGDAGWDSTNLQPHPQATQGPYNYSHYFAPRLCIFYISKSMTQEAI